MSKALVLVAGLYVFLAPIFDKQERKSMNGNNESRTRQKAPQIELLAIAYVLLFSCFFHSLFFFFFLNLFFSLILLIYIFPAKSTQELTTKKFELNWIKYVVYTK